MPLTAKEYYESLIRKGYRRDGKGGWYKTTKAAGITEYQGDGQPAQLQKHEASHPRPANRQDANPDTGQDKKADGCPRKRYLVTVIFLLDDNRKRDAFGMLETVADCLVRAIRRFCEGDTSRSMGSPPRSKRRGGNKNSDI